MGVSLIDSVSRLLCIIERSMDLACESK
jgi:hypothetical protein